MSTLQNSFFRVQLFDIFSQALNFTSVELNRFAKQAKLLKNPFFKSDGGHAISRQEKRRLPKSTARFPAKKRRHSFPPPPPVGLSWDSPRSQPRVCTGVQTLTSNQNFSDLQATKRKKRIRWFLQAHGPEKNGDVLPSSCCCCCFCFLFFAFFNLLCSQRCLLGHHKSWYEQVCLNNYTEHQCKPYLA